MTLIEWLLAASVALALTVGAVFGCAAFYRRKILKLQQRFEQSRMSHHQFAAQTKKQIAQLQQELAARPRQAEPKAIPTPTPTPTPPPIDTDARKRSLGASLDASAAARRLPVDGFADTQPL